MQRPTLTERMILAPPKEGAKYEVSLPPLEPESQGQHAPGTKDLVPVLGLRPQTSILRAGKAGEALFKAPEGHSPGPPITYVGHLDPVLHHSGPVPATMLGSPSQVVITQVTNELYWLMAALTADARCCLPCLCFGGQTEPRHCGVELA